MSNALSFRNITCAKCNKPVAGKMIETDLNRVVTLTVWCHGASDSFTFDPRKVDPAEVVELVAFRTEALPARRKT